MSGKLIEVPEIEFQDDPVTERQPLVDFPNYKVFEITSHSGKKFIEIEQSVQPEADYYIMEEYYDEVTQQWRQRKICDI